MYGIYVAVFKQKFYVIALNFYPFMVIIVLSWDTSFPQMCCKDAEIDVSAECDRSEKIKVGFTPNGPSSYQIL
jgi:hypothetical protein